MIAETFTEWSSRLQRFCAQLLRNRHDAEEIVQEVFQRLLAEPDRFDLGKAPEVLLFRMARNRCIDARRKRAARNNGGGLFGTLCDQKRRLPATVYLRYINNDKASPMYRKVFWPALVALCIGLIVGCFVWSSPVIWHGVVQTSGILTFVSGSIEAMRRHTTRQARAVFALYADGALEPEDTAAIDDARKKDQEFDADVVTYLEISEQVSEFAAGI